MGCSHPDVDCEDCEDIYCQKHPFWESQIAKDLDLEPPQSDCSDCAFKHIYDEFIRPMLKYIEEVE